MRRLRVRSILSCICVLGLAVSCQTGNEIVLEYAEPGPFHPEFSLSRMHLSEGRYPNLYSAESYAVWVDRGVAEVKLRNDQLEGISVSKSLATNAEYVEENYIVVECRLESVFPDASIAYDVIGLRNVDTYLMLPDGVRLRPIQRILGSHADEESIGTLKRFGRTNVLVFPKTDIMMGGQTLEDGTAGVRLIVEGFNSTYYFEWVAAPILDADGNPLPLAPQNPRTAGRLGFSALYSKLQVLAHNFQ